MPVGLIKLETRGRTRAEKNNSLVRQQGSEDPTDTFLDLASGVDIHDPWMSSCGRFKVDPYEQYGRAFVEWLFKGSS